MRVRLARALRRAAYRLDPRATTVTVDIDGAAVLRAINLHKRKRGEPGL